MIKIGERVVNDVPPKNRDIAMVFQNYALYPHMTVYENLAFGLKLRKYPKVEIERRVRDAAEILDLEAEYQTRSGMTEDHREAARAVAEKRAPVFRGR